LVTAEARLEAISSAGLPDVLVHGDAHPGNARIDDADSGSSAGGGIWFDWGDSRVGHPVLDMAVLLRPEIRDRERLISHWLQGWRRRCPSSRPERAWQLVGPLAALGDAVVYSGFLDGIE